MRLPQSLASLVSPESSTRNLLRDAWDALSPLPGGATVFSKLVGRTAPYTGSIDAHVVELRSGFARVTMADRPGLRNHLRSVHAVALVNLAELCGNAALQYALPDDARFIVSRISIEYVKKSRGVITATSEFAPPTSSERQEIEVPVTLRDPAGEVVARVTLTSLVGPKKRTTA